MVFRTSRYLSLHTQFQLNSSKCTGVRLQNQGAWENRFSPVKSMLQSSTIHSAKLLVCQMPWQRHASWAMPFALQISTLDDRLPVAMQRWCLVFMDVYGTCDICPAEQRCCIMLLCGKCVHGFFPQLENGVWCLFQACPWEHNRKLAEYFLATQIIPESGHTKKQD